MKVCVRALVKGRVQGVGFRWFIRQHADSLGLVGYVRNLPNGDVEFLVEGEDNNVEALLNKARKGPTFSKVTDLFSESRPISGHFDSFDVTF